MCIKLVIETSLYYDARSEKHQNSEYSWVGLSLLLNNDEEKNLLPQQGTERQFLIVQPVALSLYWLHYLLCALEYNFRTLLHFVYSIYKQKLDYLHLIHSVIESVCTSTDVREPICQKWTVNGRQWRLIIGTITIPKQNYLFYISYHTAEMCNWI